MNRAVFVNDVTVLTGRVSLKWVRYLDIRTRDRNTDY